MPPVEKTIKKLRVRELRIPLEHDESVLEKAILDTLEISHSDLIEYSLVKESIDARKSHVINLTYIVDVTFRAAQEKISRLMEHPHLQEAPPTNYIPPSVSVPSGFLRPIIVGTGPCGLFAGLSLAQLGLKPLLIERGKQVGERVKDVRRFWSEGVLDPESNVQFGEGGAGTFSDGKLTTQIKDKRNRLRKVLEELVQAGAREEILYRNKPHIGTDILVRVVTNLRQRIQSLGGEFLFESIVSDLIIEGNQVIGVRLDGGEEIELNAVVLAVGHSSRDTFAMLKSRGVDMKPKPFSIGVRIEHPQTLIDRDQFGQFAGHRDLGHADYKLVHHCKNGRSVYTFCMCPGGEVIASSSEADMLVTNGMSRYDRDKPNANSALLVGVRPEDFHSTDVMAGVQFQRHWERLAFQLGGGNYYAPVQTVGDLLKDRPSSSLGNIVPSYQPGIHLCHLGGGLPEYVIEAFREALPVFDRKLPGFANPEVPMTGVETRSSSPLRIMRDEFLESISTKGLFPAGEGAGYAGGIVSSAVDGIKVAEEVAKRLC